jgi:hypothetical protein
MINTTARVSAETVEERRRCGSKEIRVEAQSIDALCHGAIGVNKACSNYKGIVDADCNGFAFSTATPRNLCCASCPIDADRFNDKPCQSAAIVRELQHSNGVPLSASSKLACIGFVVSNRL